VQGNEHVTLPASDELALVWTLIKVNSSELNLLSQSKGTLMILPLVIFGYLIMRLMVMEMQSLECIPFMLYMVVPNGWKIKRKRM